MWDQTRYALEFFQKHLPFHEITPNNKLAGSAGTFVLSKPGRVYAVYLPNGGTTSLKVEAGRYSVRWYNPRSGGRLLEGSISQVKGPSTGSLGLPPSDIDQDWVVLVTLNIVG